MPKLAIIGSGVFGAWTALRARRLGYETTLLDAHGPGNDYSSSSGESRIIRLAYGGDELYTRFAMRSLQLWKSFFAGEGRPDCFRNTGALWMTREDNPKIKDVISVFDRLQVPYERLANATLAERYPQFAFPFDTVAILEPESGALLAAQSVQAIVGAARREGVTYSLDTALPPQHSNGSQIDSIATENGARIEADHFVFAGGSWLPKLFPALLADIIFPTRQELFFFRAPHADVRFQASAMPVWIDQTGAHIHYGFPDIENAGVKVASHELGPPFDPDFGDRVIGSDAVNSMRAYVSERFPLLRDAPLVSSRVCPYENTSSGDFLIDRHPQWSNVWFLGGGSGHGFKHGPAVAEYLLQRMRDEVDPEPRFAFLTKETALQRKVV